MRREKATGRTTIKCARTTILGTIEMIVTKRTRTNETPASKNDRNASAEDHNTGDKSGTSEKRDQNESRSENDDKRNQGGSDSGKSRGDSQRQNADSDSNSRGTSAEDDDSHHQSGRHVQRIRAASRRPQPVDDVPDSTDHRPRQIPNVVD